MSFVVSFVFSYCTRDCLFNFLTALNRYAPALALFAHNANASRVSAFRICEHDVGSVERHGFLNNLPLPVLCCSSAVLLPHIHSLNHNAILFWKRADNRARSPAVFTSYHYHFVSLF